MKRIFIIHGWDAKPEEGWYPWLKSELEKLSYKVFVPEMPDTDAPNVQAWIKTLSTIVGTPDKDTYFVGQSIGCQAILRYLETIDTPVGGAVFVAGWFNLHNLESDVVKAIARSWIDPMINIAKVSKILPQSTLFISDNDPFDAFEENKEKFFQLGSKIEVVRHAGHFDKEDGFKEVKIVLNELESMIV